MQSHKEFEWITHTMQYNIQIKKINYYKYDVRIIKLMYYFVFAFYLLSKVKIKISKYLL